MSDALLPYLRPGAGGDPFIGRRVRPGPPESCRPAAAVGRPVDDPHVERLLEGVAFLGARVQQRLDDEFPELTDALLGVLYPHYLAPFPSCSIAQFHCQPDLDAPVHLPAGIALTTEPVRGEACRFRTAWEQTLWPIEIEAVRLSGLPLAAPANPRAAGAVSVLRISLRCLGGYRHYYAGPRSFALFLACAAQHFAAVAGVAVGTRDLGGVCRRTVRYAAGDPAALGGSAGGLRAGAGPDSLAGAELFRIPTADRVFRLSGKVPVSGLRRYRDQDTAAGGPAPRHLRLSGSGAAGAGTAGGVEAWRWGVRRW